MCFLKVIVGSWVRLHGMDSGGGTVKMGGGQGAGAQGAGRKKYSGNGSSKEVVSEEVRGPGARAVSNS